MVAVLVRAAGLITRACSGSVACARCQAADRPDAGALGRRFPGWAVAETNVRPAGSRSVTLHVGGVGRAGVGQRDGEGDGVADVGRGVADRLAQRQVGLLRVDRGAVAVVGRCSGSNWSAWLMRRRVRLRVGADHRGGDGQRLRHAGGRRCRRSRCRWSGCSCPGWAWPRRRSRPAGSMSCTVTLVAASGPLLVSGDGEGDRVADVGRRVARPSW